VPVAVPDMSRTRLGRGAVSSEKVGRFLASIDYENDAKIAQEDSLAQTVRMNVAADANVEKHRTGHADWILRAAVRGMNSEHQQALPKETAEEKSHNLSLSAGFHMVPAEDAIAALSQTVEHPFFQRTQNRSSPDHVNISSKSTPPTNQDGSSDFLDQVAQQVETLQQQYQHGLSDLRQRESGLIRKLQQLQMAQVPLTVAVKVSLFSLCFC